MAVTGSNPNYSLREIIESMPVRCPAWERENDARNKKRKRCDDDEDDGEDRVAVAADLGCDWKGKVKYLKDHEKVCDFKIIRCNVHGCEHMCKRMDMEDHLSSGAGIMKHTELCYQSKMKAMEQKYEGEMVELESKMRMEANHLRYVDDCTNWVEYKRQDALTFNFTIHQIRRSNVRGNPISGLLCEIIWIGGRIPMTFRYNSAIIVSIIQIS